MKNTRPLSAHRLLWRTTGVAAIAWGSLPAMAAVPFNLNFLGQQQVATGATFGGTTIGGLSGIDYDRVTQTYLAISDDRSQINDARFYTVKLDLGQFNRNATPADSGVQFTGVTTLRDPMNVPYASGQIDPESIRKVGDRLLYTSEGERVAGNLQQPFVREARLDGSYISEFAVPSYYGVNDPALGIRRNLAFESLTVSNDGRTVYSATENALLQDGPAAARGMPTPSRVIAFDRASGAATAEYLYQAGPVVAEPVPVGSFATNGLVELLAVPGTDGQFLALERSFSNGVGNSIRLYLTSLDGATDILGDITAPSDAAFLRKELLFDLDTLGITLDNIEGITFGPDVGGSPTLVLVSDNNFDATQVTQFLAFQVSAVPEPQTWALMLGGLALLINLARRRRQP